MCGDILNMENKKEEISMKKLLSAILVFVLCLSLFSCYSPPSAQDNGQDAASYFVRPFSTDFYGKGESGLVSNSGKLDVTAEHSAFVKGSVELTVHFALDNNPESSYLQNIDAYTICISSSGLGSEENVVKSQEIEKVVEDYEPEEFRGFYEDGNGCIIDDEDELKSLPESCKYNHSDLIAVDPELFNLGEGRITFKVYVKYGDRDDLTLGASSTVGSDVYYKMIDDKVYLSNSPFANGLFIERDNEENESYSWKSDGMEFGIGEISSYCILDYEKFNDTDFDVFRVRSYAGGRHEIAWFHVRASADGAELETLKLISATFDYDGEISIMSINGCDKAALLLPNDSKMVEISVLYNRILISDIYEMPAISENIEIHRALTQACLSEQSIKESSVSPIVVNGRIIGLEVTSSAGETKKIF